MGERGPWPAVASVNGEMMVAPQLRVVSFLQQMRFVMIQTAHRATVNLVQYDVCRARMQRGTAMEVVELFNACDQVQVRWPEFRRACMTDPALISKRASWWADRRHLYSDDDWPVARDASLFAHWALR